MAVFENSDLFNIRMFRKRHPQDELFKVINLDGQWRLSSVVRVRIGSGGTDATGAQCQYSPCE